MSQRLQSEDFKDIFTQDIASLVKNKKEGIGKLLTAIRVDVARQLQQDEEVDFNLNKETEQLVKNFEAKKNKSKEQTEEGTLSSQEGEAPEDSQVLYMRELERKRFFDEMKLSGTHDHHYQGEVGPAVAFYRELRAKNCVIIPEFARI